MQAVQTTTNLQTNVVPSKLIRLARILVATDFSPTSDMALDYAVSLAKRYGSQLYLAHVISGDAYPLTAPEVTVSMLDQQRLSAEKAMKSIEASGRLDEISHVALVEEGPLWASLQEIIAKYKIDLVVAGTHGGGAFHKVMLGSGAEQIFRHAKVPVFTIGPAAQPAGPELGFRNILFATDFGLGAEREAMFAFSLAEEHQAKITLLHVIQHPDDYTETQLVAKKQAITHELQELVPIGAESWCQPEFRTAFGGAVDEILRIANQTKADLIVMGAKPRGGFIGHNPRTKAYRVVCNAKCPVVTVRS